MLVIPDVAFWVTSWPFAEYVRHAWPGAWVCSAFRNERPDLHRSSDLIREAVAATLAVWPEPPALGMITFVDVLKTRAKGHPGFCYRKAGFVPSTPTHTRGGLVSLQLLPIGMPPARAALPMNWDTVINEHFVRR